MTYDEALRELSADNRNAKVDRGAKEGTLFNEACGLNWDYQTPGRYASLGPVKDKLYLFVKDDPYDGRIITLSRLPD